MLALLALGAGDGADGRDAADADPPPHPRRAPEPAFGRLYAANTIGAIIGTLAAGLVLIELLGLTGALVVGAACSGDRRASLAVLLARRHEAPRRRSARAGRRAPARPTQRARLEPARRLALLTVAFISGLTSLGYQVLWTRLLASGTGNTTYVFTMILGVFLIGIALGAMLFNLVRPRIGDPVRLLAAPRSWSPRLRSRRPRLAARRPEHLRPEPAARHPRSAGRRGDPRRAPVTVVLGLELPGRVGAARPTTPSDAGDRDPARCSR